MFKRNRFWGLLLTVVLVMVAFKTWVQTPPPDYFP